MSLNPDRISIGRLFRHKFWPLRTPPAKVSLAVFPHEEVLMEEVLSVEVGRFFPGRF